MANSYDDFDWVKGFLQSAVEGIPEVIGITPSTETLNWRQDNPIGGIVSDFAGMATPYLGWAGMAAKIPKAAKTISAIGDLTTSPISTMVKRELATFAPFEGLRLGASQAFGDNSFSDELWSSITNLALGAGVAGLIGGVVAAGLRDPKVPTMFPGIDIAAPNALQARHMKGLIDAGHVAPEHMPLALRTYDNTIRAARIEELGPNLKYVQDIPAVTPNIKGLDNQLNRWFRPTERPDGKALQIRAFSRATDKNFAKTEDWRGELEFAGVNKDDFGYGQYFRSVKFNPTAGTKMPATVDNRITKSMDSVGDNWFMSREGDDGMFVMAKKYTGEPGKAASTDRWLLLKTDAPGHFVPNNQKWADAVAGLESWLPQSKKVIDGGRVYNNIAGGMDAMPFRNYRTIFAKSRLGKLAIDKLGPIGDSEITHNMKEYMRALLTPRGYQFTKAPRAAWISFISKLGRESVDHTVNELVNGSVELTPGQLFFPGINKIDGPTVGVKPLRTAHDAVSEDEWQRVIFPQYIRPMKPTAEAEAAYQRGEISAEALEDIKAHDAVFDVATADVNKAEIAVGKTPTKWLPFHRGFTHRWEGDTRIPILNEKGVPVHVSGGLNKNAAQQDAKKVLAEHPNWKQGDAYSISDVVKGTEKIDESLKPIVTSPSFLLERQGMSGYKWYDRSPTKAEWMEEMQGNLTARYRYQMELSNDKLLSPALMTLAREDPAMHKQVVQRMNADLGKQGAFSKMVNRAVDELLAPTIGNNSASKIVSFTNNAQFIFQMGALNLSYPMTGLVTFIQTTLPEIAMVLNGLPDRLAPYYSFALAGGTRGPQGAMGILQPMRLVSRGLREMVKPSDDVLEAMNWGYNNRTLEPRLHEDYIGESTTKIKDLGKFLKGDKKDFNFVSWLHAFSNWLPANAERLSRTHTFVTGYIIARDLLRSKTGAALSKDQAFNFAKQLTEKTMYLYGAADRPVAFTGPVGSSLGLFKNWMFNYMAAMGQYTQEAFLFNNWSPLLWQTAGTFAIGGLASTPLYTVADQFAKAFGYNDALQLTYEEAGVSDGWFDPADGIMYGLPALLTGASFYSQVQAPGSNPMRDASSLFDAVIFDRMNYMGKAMGSAWDHWRATGEHPGSDPKTRLQLARAFAPATIYRFMAATTDGDVLSPSTGYPLAQGLSHYEKLLYALKINPVDVDKAMAVSNALYEKKEARANAVAQLGEAFANAQIAGDSEEMALVARQAAVWGVDVSSVLRSAMNRIYMSQDSMMHRGYSAVDIQDYSAVQ